MKNHEKFANFIAKFKDANPVLVESIQRGFAVVFETSTEQRVKQIEANLNVKPIDEAPITDKGDLDALVQPEPLDKDKDKPVQPTV